MEVRHKEDLHLQLEQQKVEMEGRITDSAEKAKLEGKLCLLSSTVKQL